VSCFGLRFIDNGFYFLLSYESRLFLRDANTEKWGYHLDNYITKQAWREKARDTCARILSEKAN